ncbi:hypothetical protein BGZ65_006895 [Modicella reniformis]|uniref:Lysyl-tRNA synthetase n=1 Tax=Modicella reniformis TaxID=1440133 RepID=A0A9P6SSQ4_9FUNG|nr:hypothetical protein BGZ65_006895 [Modicella reniformis]
MSTLASWQRFSRLWSGRFIHSTTIRFSSQRHPSIAPFTPGVPRQLSTEATLEPWLVKPEERLEELSRLGITPYPRYKTPKIPIVDVQDIINDYQDVLENGTKDETKKVSINGRIHSKRDSSSKLVWFDLIQDGHSIQAVFSRRNYAGSDQEFELIAKNFHRGDIVHLTGQVGKTKTGQLSVFITEAFELLSPCLHSIPTRSGLKDPEKRFRNRHLDFLVNSNGLEILKKRRDIIKFIRQYLDSRNFLEVETPILSTQAGGANAKPFATHANALDMEMHMRVAPELYLKQLVIGGVDRVYEMGKQFRNEGVDADHNPEFTTCEFYQAYANLETLFEMTEDMLQEMAKSVTGSTKVSAALLKGNSGSPTFLWGHPIIMSPLAKDIKLESGRVVAGRFELFVAGREIVNAYEELNDPIQQKDRFIKQQHDKDKGDEEAQPMDQAFCNALEYGLPPTAGWGMGVDRVCQILTGSSHIRDVLAFPTMRTQHVGFPQVQGEPFRDP